MAVISVNRSHNAAPGSSSSTSQRVAGSQSTSKPQGVPVLPAVDVNLGTVTFRTPTGFSSYWSADARLLVEALGQAVCPPHWIPELATLVVTVAQTGVRTGRRIGFRLAI